MCCWYKTSICTVRHLFLTFITLLLWHVIVTFECFNKRLCLISCAFFKMVWIWKACAMSIICLLLCSQLKMWNAFSWRWHHHNYALHLWLQKGQYIFNTTAGKTTETPYALSTLAVANRYRERDMWRGGRTKWHMHTRWEPSSIGKFVVHGCDPQKCRYFLCTAAQ